MPDKPEDEVVRLGAADAKKERVGKMYRTGSGAFGATVVDGEHGPMIDEVDVEEVEEVDVEDVWQQGKRQSPMGLVVLAGILGLVVLGVTLLLIPKGDSLVQEKVARLAAEREAEAKSLQEAAVLMEHIEGVVSSYLKAATVEEKLRYVRHRERVRPLMEEYYAERPLVSRGYERVTAFYPIGVENEPFLFMQVRGGDGNLVALLLEQVGEDEVQVDWETDVAYQPMPVSEFLEKRPEEAMTFRLFAKLDMFYAYEFEDAKRYQSLMLTERDSDTYLFGYVERGSEVHEKVMEILSGDPKRKEPVLLKVRFLPDSRATRSVLIEEVVAQRWALVGVPDGGK